MHLPMSTVLSTPPDIEMESPAKLVEGDDAISPVHTESPQHTVVAEPDNTTPVKVHETESFFKELESLRSLVMSLHELQLSVRQENLETRELLMQRMSTIAEDVQALKVKKAAVLDPTAMPSCVLRTMPAHEVYGTFETRGRLRPTFLCPGRRLTVCVDSLVVLPSLLPSISFSLS